jgi:septation ring formation regulator EzrA
MIKKTLIIFLFLGVLVGTLTTMFLMRTEKKPELFTRSVTTIRLQETNPVEKMKLTGTVEAWKEEDLSFEVPGRIEWVIDKGTDVQGSQHAYSLANGKGALIATLAPEEYILKLKAAEANVKTTKARLDALKINVKEVISRQLEAAKADMDNAVKEFKRVQGLRSKNVISQKVYDTAETTLKKYQAKYSEVKSSIVVKKA